MKINSISHYIDKYKKINFNNNLKNFKIAILSSSTIKRFEEVLYVKCHELNLNPDILIGDYKQYNQEILDNNSKLYKFSPDIIFLFIDTMSLLEDKYFDYYNLSYDDQKELFKSKKIHLISLIENMEKNLNSKIVVHNFNVPYSTHLGILENKQELGFIEFVENLNRELCDLYKSDSQVFIFDYNSFLSKIGKRESFDYKMYYLGDIKINLNYLPLLADEYINYIKPLMSIIKKCIVLDLDNTLWGGIIGEDGIEGVKLGPTPEGRSFMEFQKYILSLYNKGVILAINSKNNINDVLEVFRDHPYMILKERHFASIRINWNDKISNMKSISEELNIGLDSFIFLDDDKLNREMIRKAYPEIMVIELPEDPSEYLDVIKELGDFNTFELTEEDKKRGKMYAEQRKRLEIGNLTTNITEYIKALESVVTIEKANSFNIPRIYQLLQKTNQFNTTTKRYTEEDIKKFSINNNFLIFSVKVEDKFGDNGITGVVIVKKNNDIWNIDSFLLSCRVIGRKIEEVILAYIINEAKKNKIKKLTAEFIPTKKNIPAKDFYKENGFNLLEEKDNLQIWIFPMEKEYKYPEYIKTIKK